MSDMKVGHLFMSIINFDILKYTAKFKLKR